MIHFFRKKRRYISILLLTIFVLEMMPLRTALALTSGPSQPEVQSFQPAGTSDMVDLFSGDFSYNIPLFELPGPNGGYPFNLSYQSGINTDQEASWVGLGWNLQPGAINRQVRGLPDEFNGEDKIQTKMSIAPNVTVGVGTGVGVELFGGDLSLGLGFSVYQNNYRGAGYSIDGSIGFGKSSSSGATAGIGLGFSLDSKEGVSLSPTLSLGNKDVNVGLGIGYNSKEGLTSLSFDANMHSRWSSKIKPGEESKKSKQRSFAFGAGTSLSFTHPSYTPQITYPMNSSNIAATLKIGGAFWGIYGSAYLTGFYNEQTMVGNKRWVSAPAYGYLNYQKAEGIDNSLMDVNREKDGIVSAISPNLPIPSLTYDIYSVTGQGISAMYRPFRNDFGTTKDQKISSESSGGSGGIDFGPALTHVGLNLSLNYSRSESGFWNNDMSAKAKFGSGDLGSLYEPVYFKAHGEPSAEAATTLDALGGDRAVRVKLRDSGNSAEATSQLQYSNRNTWAEELPAADKSQGRKTRNQTIQTYTNSQILNGAQEVLPHFRIQYFNENNNEVDFDRSTLRPHHTTAFTALTPEGLRYNYGIPAYNFRHEELTFSVKKKNSDTDQVEIDLPNPPGNLPDYDKEPRHDPATSVEKYLRRVKTPEYAHSFLLTSILGPDYVDVTGDGVTADDLGYWVKFTYQRTATKESPFKWRDPFIKAHLQEGWKSDPRDDKGSFVYGEKEIWYMRRAETKSHIADFIVSSRDDGRGIETKLQNAPVSGSGKRLSKLDRIVLYTRFANATHPIKEVHFEYNYSLCANTLNSYPSGSNPNKGKLTLNKLFFKYGTSGRGEFNPYQFSYASNYSYQMLSYDRWGNYKPNNTTGVMNNDFPYVNQDPARKADIDNYAAAWSLSEIQLPSGGTVKVDYETDDYAYVQHKQAMQMTEVVNPNVKSNSAGSSTTFQLEDGNPKVRFKLEKQIDSTHVTDDPTWQKNEVLKYVDASTYQLYFKFLISLRKPSEGFSEYISGYVDIDKDSPMTLELDASGKKYVYGSFYVKKEDGNGDKNRNPFAMRAWQHLRTNQPELTNSGAPVKATDKNNEKINQMMGVGSIFDQVSRMFKGFYKFCSDFGWGREVTVGKAWVRLKSPDKIKYGGGLRVKQITMKDNWQGDEEGVYGQVYDYTTLEVENGPTISSGVAAYEPFVGGEENPLRYAKKYTESVPLRADNNLFFEYPINESYYPGPQVGYSKVTVSSLASASLAGKPVTNSIFPTGTGVSFGTSGKTVHEFYTAKDFPVITDETEKENQPYRLSVTIPFIGSLSISKLTASQGYSIITNDMHGKQKKVSNYRQDPAGKFEPEPISWVKYNYKSEPRFYQQERVFSLSNKFIENGDGTLSFPEPNNTSPLFTLGQENEFFMDMRKFEDNAYTGGVRINLDILYFFFITIPAYVPWPSVGLSENQLRTAVTNKVVFKSGMMESIEAFDGGSLIKTENRKWDKQTGAVVLTLVNNNFDAPVFSYNILAHQKYQGMGAAYQNSGLTFTAVNVKAVPNQANQYEFAVKEFVQAGSLYPGDELLLYNSTGNIATPLARAVYTGEENGINKWHSEQALAATSYKALIVRSGYRNQLSVSAGNITALEDPSKKGGMKAKFSRAVQIPK